ncbi:beta-1,4-galactosyltransferase 1-like [Scleropages formosus]|uniref:Beta-1,4-galactosyltransferase n=1 Tax=Scleropages formosus TaxID=113540 RepID=A0A0P7Y2C4_SCLFO|nr:beta-1,4-galactosyltransferase 1-like [Scleropages formosus]
MRDSLGNLSLLQRICTVVVLLCFVHISVTLLYYLRTLDLRGSFLQNQQANSPSPNEAKEPAGVTEAHRLRSALGSNVSGEAGGGLEPCPERSPLLGECARSGPVPCRSVSLKVCLCASYDDVNAGPSAAFGPADSSCHPTPLGPLRIEFSNPVSLDLVRSENPRLSSGGRYKPTDCIALQKVAMIIPFRNRDEHLKFWLYYLHPILQRQQLDYGVYIINQGGEEAFNRAKLLNIGYAEALKEYDYDCFVFSDVDLIPMDDRNTYKCFSQPRHLSVSMDKFGFKLPYNQYFGGVSSMSKQQFLKINGFPNDYWGWGGEDDDIFNRLSSRGMSISRPSGEIGKCRMIRHDRDKQNEPNPQRYAVLVATLRPSPSETGPNKPRAPRFDRIAHTRETMNRDGINSLSYKVIKVEKDLLFTKITVDVGKPPA